MSLVIGFDPGFGGTKAAAVNGTLKVSALPSVVGVAVGSLDMGLLEHPGAPSTPGRRRRAATPHQVAFDGLTYLVGENVTAYTRPMEQRMDFARLSDGPELRSLFYATLHGLLGAGEHPPLTVIVGLPVAVMLDREQALSTRRDLRAWMQGPHTYQVNGEPMTLHIERVDIMAQPAGSYFAWGLDDRGQWSRPPAAAKALVGICDVGFNTVDLFVVQEGQVVPRYTAGESSGMRRAAELVAQAVRQRHGIDLGLHEADGLMRATAPQLSTSGGVVDLLAVTTQAREAVATGIVSFTERQWGNAKQFAHILFVGGGAEALRPALARHYPHGLVLAEAVTANAIGLARYGLRLPAPA